MAHYDKPISCALLNFDDFCTSIADYDAEVSANEDEERLLNNEQNEFRHDLKMEKNMGNRKRRSGTNMEGGHLLKFRILYTLDGVTLIE